VSESFDEAYYANRRSRVTSLIHSFEALFTPEQTDLLVEMVEHNEPGVAVEMLSAMLLERRARITQTLFDDLRSLVLSMRLNPEVSDRLRPLVCGD
jgi:hypothetical protein